MTYKKHAAFCFIEKMKKKLCFEKYRKNSILYSVSFLACLLLSAAMPGEMQLIGGILSIIILGYAAYSIYAYFAYQKKVKDLTPCTGIISNWKVSGHRSSWGCVVLNHEGVAYCSPNYFHTYEAEEMVGKAISYVILDDTLLIYEIFN